MFRSSLARIEARAVADLEIEAVQEYLKEHANGRGAEEILNLEITAITTEQVRRPGGNILVTVSILSRKPWKHATYAFRLQTRGRKVRRLH